MIVTLNPVGHQSTNCTVLFNLMDAIDAFTSLGTTSPLYNKQTAIYFPFLGSHLTWNCIKADTMHYSSR